MTIFLSLLPLLLVVFLMTKKNPWSAARALPLASLILLGIVGGVLRVPWKILAAEILNGLLTAWTPLLVVFGAIFLFKVMEFSGSLQIIRQTMSRVSTNKVAQLMIVAWAFSFLIEGASGFGTPAALAAPLLVGLGFQPLGTAALALIMNSVPVSFGAVGTPIWFGLGHLGLSSSDLLSIGAQVALVQSVAALFIPLLALRVLLPWTEIRKNLGFIYLSILSCVLPYLVLAQISYEFPSLAGGAIGLTLSIVAARFGIGLSVSRAKIQPLPPFKKILSAFFPLWGTVLLLVLTRIPELGLKALLRLTDPALTWDLGFVGLLRLSPSLVVELSSIFKTSSAFKIELLYIPALLPFVAIGLLFLWMTRQKHSVYERSFSETFHRLKSPFIALSGALVFSKLLMAGGTLSVATLLGNTLAYWFSGAWPFFASFLGALGSFFAGSNTVSNLTFGGIQASIASTLGLPLLPILALQTVGGAMGNMICIHNIVAVCSILGLNKTEGLILKKTILPLLVYGLLAAGLSMVLL